MSAESDSGEVVRSVSASRGPHPNAEMSAIGYLVFLPILVVLFPLLPLVAVYWLLAKLLE
jgi:hypothetical protein